MSDINSMKLRRLDLTLLLVFLGLLQHRKATVVADDLGVTQPSISHALKRLREVFDDELFLRRPHGFEPTAVALALEPTVREAVDGLRRALAGSASFDPGSSSATVRIAAYDYELATLVPDLVRTLEREAPAMRVITSPLGRAEALRALADGSADLALGYFWDLDDAFTAHPLFTESYRVVGRNGHPLFGKRRLTARRFAAARHVVVSPAGDLSGIVDRELARAGLTREVGASVPLFFPALATVASTDLVATLPSRLVRRFGPAFGLENRPPPFPIRDFTVSAVGHRRNARNPLHQWVVGALGAATEQPPVLWTGPSEMQTPAG